MHVGCAGKNEPMSGDVLELPDPTDGRPLVIMMPGAEAAPRDGTADGVAGQRTPGGNAGKSGGSAISGGCAFNDDGRLNPSRGIARGIVLSLPAWALMAWALYLML
jgi:hypothetical protein